MIILADPTQVHDLILLGAGLLCFGLGALAVVLYLGFAK